MHQDIIHPFGGKTQQFKTEFCGREITIETGKMAFLADGAVTVRYGDTVVVTGATHERGTQKGKPYEHYGRFTDTWVPVGGTWKCVASHTNLITK